MMNKKTVKKAFIGLVITVIVLVAVLLVLIFKKPHKLSNPEILEQLNSVC